jgi:outer membrane biosynthesis protein TonB
MLLIKFSFVIKTFILKVLLKFHSSQHHKDIRPSIQNISMPAKTTKQTVEAPASVPAPAAPTKTRKVKEEVAPAPPAAVEAPKKAKKAAAPVPAPVAEPVVAKKRPAKKAEVVEEVKEVEEKPKQTRPYNKYMENTIRKYKSDPKNSGVSHKDLFKQAAASWSALSDTEKAAFTASLTVA